MKKTNYPRWVYKKTRAKLVKTRQEVIDANDDGWGDYPGYVEPVVEKPKKRRTIKKKDE